METNISYVEDGDYYIVRAKVGNQGRYKGKIPTLGEARSIKEQWMGERKDSKDRRRIPIDPAVAKGWGYG